MASGSVALTFNATLTNLLDNQRLCLWRPQNSTSIVRYLFMTTVVARWVKTLAVKPEPRGNRRHRLSEYEQVAGLFDEYAAGQSAGRLAVPGMEPPFKLLTHRSVARLHVWEARLTYTRVFGWCVEPGVWVAVDGSHVARLKAAAGNGPGSYEAYARSVARWRRTAGFGGSDVWKGTDLDAFLTRPRCRPVG